MTESCVRACTYPLSVLNQRYILTIHMGQSMLHKLHIVLYNFIRRNPIDCLCWLCVYRKTCSYIEHLNMCIYTKYGVKPSQSETKTTEQHKKSLTVYKYIFHCYQSALLGRFFEIKACINFSFIHSFNQQVRFAYIFGGIHYVCIIFQ